MQGVITSRHVVLQGITIIRLWGVATWLACVWAVVSREQTTFLGVLYGR